MTKTFDLEEFKLFVAGKPADERYPACDAGRCALAQFGFKGMAFYNIDQAGIPQAVYCAAAHDGKPTYGALLSRLNNLPAESPTADEVAR